MPIPLSKVPRGLLELLNARTLGFNPPSLAEQVIPVVELGDFYASSQLLNSGPAVTTGAITPTLQNTLTQTTTLGIRAFSAAFVCGAAAATNVSICVGYSLGKLVVVASQFCAQIAAGNTVRVGASISRLVLPPGAIWFAEVAGTAAGADHVIAVTATIENYTLQG